MNFSPHYSFFHTSFSSMYPVRIHERLISPWQYIIGGDACREMGSFWIYDSSCKQAITSALCKCYTKHSRHNMNWLTQLKSCYRNWLMMPLFSSLVYIWHCYMHLILHPFVGQARNNRLWKINGAAVWFRQYKSPNDPFSGCVSYVVLCWMWNVNFQAWQEICLNLFSKFITSCLLIQYNFIIINFSLNHKQLPIIKVSVQYTLRKLKLFEV